MYVVANVGLTGNCPRFTRDLSPDKRSQTNRKWYEWGDHFNCRISELYSRPMAVVGTCRSWTSAKYFVNSAWQKHVYSESLIGSPTWYRWGHSKKLFKRWSRLDITKHVFSNRTVDKWNALPDSCMQCTTVNDYKTKIELQLKQATLNRM